MIQMLRRKLDQFLNEKKKHIEIAFYSLVFVSIALIFIQIGFPVGKNFLILSLVWNHLSLFLFALLIFTEFLLSFNKKNFFKENRFSIILSSLFIIDLIIALSFDNTQSFIRKLMDGNLDTWENYFIISVQLIVIIVLFTGRFSLWQRFLALNISPIRLFSGAFLFMILVGSILLLLPNSTHQGISVLDAIFTATSASCVTGLTVVNTGTDFTFTGQVIILVLIQLGGLGIMTITVFFIFIGGRKATIKDMLITRELVNIDSIENINHLLFKIVKLSFIIEIIGAALLFLYWKTKLLSGDSLVFESIFFSISAFCNAGFSLYSDSFMSQHNDSISLMIISILVILGGLGTATILELLSYFKVRFFKHKRYRFSIQSQLVLKFSALLLLLGTVFILIFESSNSMLMSSFLDKLKHAFFQSVVSRTAGFNSLDFAEFLTPSILIVVVLMFIGGASGSTAGGVKVNTFAVLLVNLKRILFRKSKTIVKNRSIPDAIFQKSILVFVLSLSFVMIIFFLLTITDAKLDPLQLLFETVSAFATVGLSTGITADLSEMGKLLIILTMFIGRIGIIAFALSFTGKSGADDLINYPKEGVQVG